MPAIHYEKIELPADFPLDVTEMTLEPNYDMLGRMHWHDCFEISAINGGEGTYVVDNTGYPVKSGDIVVLNNIEPHQKVLETGAKFDFAHYWEDICFNNGPLLSPEMFEELCAKHYKRRNELCHKYGIKLISLDCDGVTEKLLPTWFNSGVNIMFPIEIGTWGDQFEPARKKFGKEMRGVGGMDKTAFRKDKAAFDAEIERVRRLAALGGLIPCPDHRIMPGSKFELVQYYADEIKKIKI